MTPLNRLNPAYVYGAISAFLSLVVGVGVIAITDAQQDLVLKFVAAIILVITGVSVAEAGSINGQVEEALQQPPPTDGFPSL